MFRVKIAFLSFLASGLIFLFFALMFLSYAERMGVERIDRRLSALASGPMRRQGGPGRGWEDAERWAGLFSAPGGASGRGLLVMEYDQDGKTCYCSSNWPAALTVPEAALRREFMQAPGRSGPPRMGAGAGQAGPRPGRPGENGIFFTREVNGARWRFAAMRRGGNIVFLGIDMTHAENELREMRGRMALIGLAALLLLAGGGWLLANQALRPIRIIAEKARGITAKDLSVRIRVPAADREFRKLIDVINGMLERLESSFQQAARFSADAAHELKTPLAILQGELSQALQQEPDGSPAQQAICSQLEEVGRLNSIVRKLLMLAQSDAGQLRLAREKASLSALADELAEDARASANGLAIETKHAPGVFASADRDLLRQLMQNLFSNAVKYNIPNGKIRSALAVENGCAVFTLANTFDAANPPDASRLFQRFYRCDPSRASRVSGHGLGLSLAREIARAHGGELTAEISEPGWLTLRLALKEFGH